MKRKISSILTIFLLLSCLFTSNVFADDGYVKVTYDGQVTPEYYQTLLAATTAINEKTNDDAVTYTMQILGNFTDNNSGIIFNKKIVLDLNGYTVNTVQSMSVYENGDLTITSSNKGFNIGAGGTIEFNGNASGQTVYDSTILNYGGTITVDGNVSISHVSSAVDEVSDYALSNVQLNGDNDPTENIITIKSGFINGVVYNNNNNSKNKIYITKNENECPPVFASKEYAIEDELNNGYNTKADAGIFVNIVNIKHVEDGYANRLLTGSEYSQINFDYSKWYEIIRPLDIADYVARNRERNILYTKLQYALDEVQTGETVELLRDLKSDVHMLDGRTDIREEILDFESSATEFTLTGQTEATGVIHTLYKVDEPNGETHTIFDLDKPGVKINFFNIIFDNNNSTNDCLHFTSGTYEFNNGVQIFNVPNDSNSVAVAKDANLIVDAKISDYAEPYTENTIKISGKLTHEDGNDLGSIVIHNGAFVLRPDSYDNKTKFKDIADESTIVDNKKYELDIASNNKVYEYQVWEEPVFIYAVIVGERSMPYNLRIDNVLTMKHYLKVRDDLKNRVTVAINYFVTKPQADKRDIYKNGVMYYSYNHVLPPQEYGMNNRLKAYKNTYNYDNNNKGCHYIMFRSDTRSLENHLRLEIQTYGNNPKYQATIAMLETCVNYGKAVLDYINSRLPDDKKISSKNLIKDYYDISTIDIPERTINHTSYSTNFFNKITMKLDKESCINVYLNTVPSGYSYSITSSNGAHDTPLTKITSNIITTDTFMLSGNGINFNIKIFNGSGDVTETMDVCADSYLYKLANKKTKDLSSDVAIWLHTLGVRMNERAGR